jgi:hypothetical protein
MEVRDEFVEAVLGFAVEEEIGGAKTVTRVVTGGVAFTLRSFGAA